MKYENFEQVCNIVKLIEKHQKLLDNLNEIDSVVVIVKNRYDTLITIGAWDSCEHEYAKIAREFAETIRVDLRNRIKNLKSNLELL